MSRESERIDDVVLARAIDALREPVPVRDAWRASVLAAVRGPAAGTLEHPAPVAARHARRLVLHPLAAIAASLLLAAGGAIVGGLAARASSPAVSPPRALVDRSATIVDGEAAGTATARFVVLAPGAQQVALVGDFNRWDASATPMRPLADGRTWIVELPLQPGRHAYAFLVDGTVAVDPAAPRSAEDDFGRPNSVIVVSAPAS